MEKNIENFDKATLLILTYLYDSFPKKVELDSFNFSNSQMVEITGWHLVPEGENDPTEEGGELYFLHYITDTLIWLIEEGYIRQTGFEPPHNFEGLVLTNKGLSLLQKPSSIDSSKRWVDMCKEEIKKGSAKGVVDVVKKLMLAGVSKVIDSGE